MPIERGEALAHAQRLESLGVEEARLGYLLEELEAGMAMGEPKRRRTGRN